MKVGIRLPQTGEQAKLENVIRLAKAADSSGLDSLWVLERLLWPISPQTRHPSTPVGKLLSNLYFSPSPIGIQSNFPL